MRLWTTLSLAGALACFAGALPAASQPARSLFRTTILVNNLTNPTQIAFLPDGRIYYITKGGTVNLYDPKNSANPTSRAGLVTVSDVKEDGLHSIVLDPNFATSRRLYLLFGVLKPSPAIVVARFTATTSGDLDLLSRKDILSVPYTITSSDEHNTGCLAFDTKGNLYIGLADNTNNFFSGTTMGFSPRDPKRPNYDAQRSAANSNDLRGKILRIHPEDDGSYTIPTGNLFAAGAQTRPEIYVMGLRHPFRIMVDEKSGWLYWAEPGPNATADNASQGPRGYDEVNLAKTAGNYGWPYCTANNFCYTDYNYQTNTGGATYNPAALKNNSTNNTGLVDLPAARPALVWYPYNATGTAFPIFGSGSANTSMLGPVYNFNGTIASPNKIPKYYDGHLFIFDFSRSLIHAVELNTEGAVVAVKRFWDQTSSNPINNPIDMKIGPDGAFYFLNWGDGGYPANSGHGNLVRLDYIGTPDALTPTPQRLRKPTEAWHTLAMARNVALPAGTAQADFYDLHGARVWTWRNSAEMEAKTLELPARLTGVLRMKVSQP